MNFRPQGSREMLLGSNQQRKILMANPLEKAPENVPGAYYNDTTCIDCDLCREMAPQFFKRQDDGGYTYVYRQPFTPEEIALAEDALASCPTDTIGNDGNKA
jgi:ferredoxin